MKKTSILMSAAALLALAACQPPAAPTKPAVDVAAEAAKIKAIETQWNEDWKAKDAAKIVAHYDTNASLLVPMAPPATGTDAISKMATETLADKNWSLAFTNSKVEVAESGELAYSLGTYSLTMTGPKKKPVTDKGSYVTVYKKDAAGDWKAVADINTSEPLPAVEPAVASSAPPASSAAPAKAASSAAPAKPN